MSNKKRIIRPILWGAFFAYCAVLLYILLLSRPFSTHYSISEFFILKSNLIPLTTVYRFVRQIILGIGDVGFAVKQLVGNFLLFLPMGAVLPCLFPRLRRFVRVVLILIGTVLLAEVAQTLLRVGCFDVDDLILNVGGGMIGYLLLKIPPLRRVLSRIGALETYEIPTESREEEKIKETVG